MRKLVSVLILCVLTVTAAGAQETRGTISGTVNDAQGVVPGATVRITNTDTNTTQVLVTNNTGYFEAPLLQPGTYRIVVEMAGFKTATRDSVALAVGQQTSLPFTLEVGNISEQVTVTGTAPVLDTTSVSSGANFDSQQISALPMFSNMPVGLARFAPGVNPDADQPPPQALRMSFHSVRIAPFCMRAVCSPRSPADGSSPATGTTSRARCLTGTPTCSSTAISTTLRSTIPRSIGGSTSPPGSKRIRRGRRRPSRSGSSRSASTAYAVRR